MQRKVDSDDCPCVLNPATGRRSPAIRQIGWSVSSVNCRSTSAGSFRLPRSPHGHRCIHISTGSARSTPLPSVPSRTSTPAFHNGDISRHRRQSTWIGTCREKAARPQGDRRYGGERPYPQSSRLVQLGFYLSMSVVFVMTLHRPLIYSLYYFPDCMSCPFETGITC
jgi:hypothetical protein